MNAIVIVSIIALFSLYELELCLYTLLRPGKAVSFAARLQVKALARIFSILKVYRGFRIEVEDGLAAAWPKRFVLVANHQSLLDIPVLMHIIPGQKPLRFVAKRELGFGIPFVSTILRSQGHGLIRRRGDVLKTMKTLDRFARRCRREDTCPVIFPEGTRSRTGEVGTFHTAGFRRIIELESLPIVVAAIEGGCRVATLDGVFRNLGASGYRVRFLKVLPPPTGKHETVAALESCRRSIAAALDAMRAESR